MPRSGQDYLCVRRLLLVCRTLTTEPRAALGRSPEKEIVMKKQITNILVTMILSAMASLTATAQSTQKLPATEARALSTKLVQQKAGNGAGFRADGVGASTDSSGITPSFSIGWNYIHPAYCELYYSGGYPYLFVYASEGGYFYTTDQAFQTVISPACQTGNWLAFYVYNSSNNWSNVWTYTYK